MIHAFKASHDGAIKIIHLVLSLFYMKYPNIYQEIDEMTHPSVAFKNLLEDSARQTLNRLIHLSCNMMNTSAAIIYLVENSNNAGKNSISVISPYRSEKEQLFIRWLCEEIHDYDLPRTVEDTVQWEFYREHPIVEASKLRSYFCIPLTISSNRVFGTFCIMDYKPRRWSTEDIQFVNELARSMMSEIKLRGEIHSYADSKEKLMKKNHQFSRVLKFTESTIFNMKGIIDKGAHPAEIRHYLDAMQDLLDCLT